MNWTYSSLLEAFDSSGSAGICAQTITNNINKICTDVPKLDIYRQTFFNAYNNIITQLRAVDANNTGLSNIIASYRSQLNNISNVTDALGEISGFFSDAIDGNGQNRISAIAQFTNVDSTSTIITESESVIKTLYSLDNRLDQIRKKLINDYTVGGLSLNRPKFLCLKKDFDSADIANLVGTLNTQLIQYIIDIQKWCVAAGQAPVSSAPTQSSGTPPQTSTSSPVSVCATNPSVALMSCADDDGFKSFMAQYNPQATSDQWQTLKNCVIAAKASSSDPAKQLMAIIDCTNKLVFNGCGPSGWLAIGPINGGSGSNQNPTTQAKAPTVPFAGQCLDLYNNCVAAGGSVDVCQALAQQCTQSPNGYCPPAPPSCSPGIGDCPATKMTWDAKQKEYDITSHPSIDQWGVKNTVWSGGSQWIPDYIAQKSFPDLANRCKTINDFDIATHKDFINFVPSSTYAKSQSQANNLQSRLIACENAFQSSTCKPNTSKTNITSVEGFETKTATAAPSTCDTPIVDDTGMTFDITTHKQYPDIMKNYTANAQLPSVCKNVIDCSTYPIENNQNISKYVLRSTVPSMTATTPTNLKDHPDFPAYESAWGAKADLMAKAAKDQANASCSAKISDYSTKDPCGNPTKCKSLADYKLEDHPGFPSYTQVWKNKLSEYAGRDKDGNIIKCKSPKDLSLDDIPAVATLKSNLNQQYHASLTALGNIDQCGKPQKCKNLNDYDITQHKDFPGYAPKDSCLTSDQLSNFVPKDKCITSLDDYAPKSQCLTSSDFSKFDITQHPDICKYVLKTSVPDIDSLSNSQQNLIEKSDACASDKAKLQAQVKAYKANLKAQNSWAADKAHLEQQINSLSNNTPSSLCDSKLSSMRQKFLQQQKSFQSEKDKLRDNYEEKLKNAYDMSVKAASVPQTASPSVSQQPDLSKYVLRSDVQPCPVISDNELKARVQKDASKYLDSSAMAKICKQTGFNGKEVSCEANFVQASNAFIEGFEDDNGSQHYPSKHSTSSSDPWNIMLHKDYQYNNKSAGHMPKQECYGTFAHIEKGVPVPCDAAMKSQAASFKSHPTAQTSQCKQLKDFNIQDHPDYDSTLMKHGAIKDQCGKIKPPPHCPCLTKDQCGNWIASNTPSTKAVKDKDNQNNACDMALVKEKLRFNILLAKYKDLSRSVSSHQTDKSKYRSQLEILNKQLTDLKQSIVSSAKYEATSQPLRSRQPLVDPNDVSFPVPNAINDSDLVQPLASARVNSGWIYQ